MAIPIQNTCGLLGEPLSIAEKTESGIDKDYLSLDRPPGRSRVKIGVRWENSPITVALSPACLAIPTIPPMFLVIAFLAVIPWRFFRKRLD